MCIGLSLETQNLSKRSIISAWRVSEIFSPKERNLIEQFSATCFHYEFLSFQEK